MGEKQRVTPRLNAADRKATMLVRGLCLFLGGMCGPSHAEVTFDGTLGRSGPANAVNVGGTTYHVISENDGELRGTNLFHSFNRFNLNWNEAAYFTRFTPVQVDNLIARVTGGQSFIDGGIWSDIPGANLWLINPQGVVFGGHAWLDVQGSFHVSTADYIRFADNARFDATNPNGNVLTTAPPEAFGFLDGNPAGLAIAGSQLINAPGRDMSLIAGDIAIGAGPGTGSGSLVAAPGGTLNMVSVASDGEVTVSRPEMELEGVEALGHIELTGGSMVNLSAAKSSSLRIRGGEFVIDGGALVSATLADGGEIDIDVADNISLSNGGIIGSASFGEGHGSDINIKADELSLAGGSRIFSESFGNGAGGTLNLEIRSQFAADSASMVFTDTFGNGNGGAIQISTRNVLMDRDAAVLALSQSAGNAGEIQVSAEKLSLRNGAQFAAISRGSGDSGNISVTVSEAVTLSGQSSSTGLKSGIFSNALGTGKGGDVFVSSGDISVDEGSEIGGSTAGPGDASDIVVSAETITVRGSGRIETSTISGGKAGNIGLTASRSVAVEAGGGILSNSFGAGDGGRISIHSPLVTVSSGTIESATGALSNTGDAGSIDISAETVRLSSGAWLNSSTGGEGNGGNIAINSARLTISDSLISAGTSGTGAGGNIDIDAAEAVAVSGTPLLPAVIFTTTTSSGSPAGNIRVKTPDLYMVGDSVIDARTLGDGGNAGDIAIDVERLSLVQGAQIGSGSGIGSTQTGLIIEGKGDGGTVAVTASDAILISGISPDGLHSGLFSQTVGEGRGGAISVITPKLVMLDGGTIGTDTGGQGRAGDIEVQAGSMTLVGGSEITSGSGIRLGSQVIAGAGGGGSISVKAEDLKISGRGSQISTNTQSAGHAGDIDIRAERFALTGGAAVTASSTGTGDAGNIGIDAGRELTMREGQIAAAAEHADGGNISVRASDRIYLVDSAITTSVKGGIGAGGNIFIDPEFVILKNSRIIADAFGGPGGNIRIVAENFFATPDSLISASSALGIDGTVRIESPDRNSVGQIKTLPARFLNAAALLRQRCGVAARTGPSSLVVDSAPSDSLYNPDIFLSADYETPAETATAEQHPDRTKASENTSPASPACGSL